MRGPGEPRAPVIEGPEAMELYDADTHRRRSLTTSLPDYVIRCKGGLHLEYSLVDLMVMRFIHARICEPCCTSSHYKCISEGQKLGWTQRVRWQDALWTQCFGDGRFARSAKKIWTVTILWSGFAPDVHATTPVPPMHATAENRVLWKLFFGERITFCVLDERHIARG